MVYLIVFLYFINMAAKRVISVKPPASPAVKERPKPSGAMRI
jgi:hypothetical protein